MSEWKEYQLDEVYDFASGLSKSADQFGFGYGFCSFKDVFKNYFLPEKLSSLANTSEKERKSCSIKLGDVFLTRTSETQEELGMSSVALKDYPEATFNGFTKRLRPKGVIEVNPEYAGYYFRSPKFRANVTSMSSMTTRASLNNDMLAALSINLPSPKEQATIGNTLKSLDNKIDLLHRQNDTLEAMAETLFRQWFVEDTKEDWAETNLFDSIELIGGGTPKTENAEYWDGNIKWLSCGDISANHKNFVVRTEKSITEIGLQNSSAKLLPKFSTVISARGTVGKYCLLSEPMAYSQSNYGIKPKFEGCFFFTYLLVAYSVNELQAAAYGSVFDTITTTTFKELKISLPESLVIQEFEEIAKPYFKKMFNNQNQIHTLTTLRDTLLPKLMSGEVRVKM